MRLKKISNYDNSKDSQNTSLTVSPSFWIKLEKFHCKTRLQKRRFARKRTVVISFLYKWQQILSLAEIWLAPWQMHVKQKATWWTAMLRHFAHFQQNQKRKHHCLTTFQYNIHWCCVPFKVQRGRVEVLRVQNVLDQIWVDTEYRAC